MSTVSHPPFAFHSTVATGVEARPVVAAPEPSPRTSSAPTVRSGAEPYADRRAHRRVQIELEVDFIGHDNFYTGFTEDISEGGLFVATYELKPLGTEVDLQFVLPDGAEISAKCVVRWVRDPRNIDPDSPPGMGLQFVDLCDEHRRQIEAFTQHREPLFYED